MDNFSVFDKQHLQERLDAFAPGMAPHVTPIKYEALTPDIFCFQFRTTGKDDKEYFFVLFSFDYMADFVQAKAMIEGWSGTAIIEMLEPVAAQAGFEHKDPQMSRYTCDFGGVYHSMLALVERPNGKGYWASYITIHSDDDVEQAVQSMGEADATIFKRIAADLRKKFGTRQYDAKFYKNQFGKWEVFYNVTDLPDKPTKLAD